MKKTLQIAAGIVIGLFCWNFLLAWSERHDRQVKHEQRMQAVDKYQNDCDKGDQGACSQAIELLTQDSH